MVRGFVTVANVDYLCLSRSVNPLSFALIMKKSIIIIVLLALAASLAAQKKLAKKTSAIVEEGKLLYRCEMASWYGTDIFVERYRDHGNISGYFSYPEGNLNKCVFFSVGKDPRVIGTITFDNGFNVENASTDLSEREFTGQEKDLYLIRTAALEAIGKDTIFKTYTNTNFNLIPVISNGEKKVYVLTGPQKTGVVIFGNDYLLTFDKKNKLKESRQLHRNILVINYGEKTENGEEQIATMHTHSPETGDFITATDICTLMLYEKYAKWKQHTVVSANYVSIWDCLTNELVTLSKEAMDKIYEQQEKKN